VDLPCAAACRSREHRGREHSLQRMVQVVFWLVFDTPVPDGYVTQHERS